MSFPNEQDTIREEAGALSKSVSRGPRTRAVLTVLRGEGTGKLHIMEGKWLVIGRAPNVELSISDDALSRLHACIQRAEDGFVIEDLNSTNGTFVDGNPVQGHAPLSDGARIQLGSRAVLHFRLHDAVELGVVCEAHAQALRDPLTGVFNRRHFQDSLWAEVAFARRHRTPLSLLLLDIDHFKRINDEHGHATGDAALQLLAGKLSSLTREEDTLARYGGEEFALVARGISRAEVLNLAERIRQLIERQRIPAKSGFVDFTVSIGVAHWPAGEGNSAQALLEAADEALYESKRAGRNSVSIAPPNG